MLIGINKGSNGLYYVFPSAGYLAQSQEDFHTFLDWLEQMPLSFRFDTHNLTWVAFAFAEEDGSFWLKMFYNEYIEAVPTEFWDSYEDWEKYWDSDYRFDHEGGDEEELCNKLRMNMRWNSTSPMSCTTSRPRLKQKQRTEKARGWR